MTKCVMFPVIFKLGPVTVYSYGFMVVIGFMVAVYLLGSYAKKCGLDPELFFNLSFIILFSGIIGARFLYVFINIRYYINNPLEIIMLNRGGLAWFGGVFIGSISGIIYLKIKHQDIYRVFDIVMPYIALGQSLGRIGCFLNGCCFGNENFHCGIFFPIHNTFLVPIQIYSSLILLGIYVFLRLKQSRPFRKGEILYSYFFLYSIKRFWVEFFRGDKEILALNLSLFQFFCIILFIISLIMLIKVKTNMRSIPNQ